LVFSWRGRTPEESLRRLYRYARNRNLESAARGEGYTQNAPRLLMHQMTELLPCMLEKAAQSR